MKHSAIALLLIFNSCQQKESLQSHDIQVVNPNNVVIYNEHKFIFVGIFKEVPTLDKFNLIEWKEKKYFSDIIEVNHYSEDKKYRIMDSIQKNVSLDNFELRAQVERNINDPIKIEELSKNYPRITYRHVFEFKTYHEASEKLSQARINVSHSDGKIEPLTVELGSSKSESNEKKD